MSTYQVFNHPDYYDFGVVLDPGWYWWEAPPMNPDTATWTEPGKAVEPNGPYDTAPQAEEALRASPNWTNDSTVQIGRSRPPGLPVPKMRRSSNS